MRISTKPIYSEEYIVKYWYKDSISGYHKQGALNFYASSKNAHKQIEKLALKVFSNLSDVRIINITYQ